jgi:ribonuclease BN (tRNA processing enzyme)
MEPKIIFLGTGGDEAVVGKQIRASGGIVIQLEDCQFHIDPGPGALVRAAQLGVNPRENTAVLVSHAHINHCNDLNAVISAMTHNGLDKKGVLITSNLVVNGDENEWPYLTKYHQGLVERVIVVKPGQKVGVEDFEIHALATNHNIENIGFKFFTPQFVLTYTSDTGYSQELLMQYGKSDIVVLNVQNPSGVKNKYQLSSDDAVKIIKKAKPRLAIITHFGNKMISVDPLYEAREIQKQTGVQILAARDGLVVNPISYSASLKQRTLNLY